MSHSNAYGVLSPAQLEGRACIVCDGQEGPMVPVTGMSSDRAAQLFEHERCRPRHELVRPARVPRRRTAAISDIEAVADGLRELRARFRFSHAGREGPGPTMARQDLVDELLEYLDNRRVS